MTFEEIQETIVKLKKSYNCGWTDGIVQSLDTIITFFENDRKGYPKDVLAGVDRNLEVFRELRDNALMCGLDIDRVAEWKRFSEAADDLAYNVLTPWLNATNVDAPFTWVQGGDA